jgi:hypothetical protein
MQNSFSGKYGSYCRCAIGVLPLRALRLPAPPNLRCARREALRLLRARLGDDDGVAWYLDPPYWTDQEHYLPGNNLAFPHGALAGLLLAHPRALWVLSYNAAPTVVALYRASPGAAVLYEVPRRGLACDARRGLGAATELLILSAAAAELGDAVLAGARRLP